MGQHPLPGLRLRDGLDFTPGPAGPLRRPVGLRLLRRLGVLFVPDGHDQGSSCISVHVAIDVACEFNPALLLAFAALFYLSLAL